MTFLHQAATIVVSCTMPAFMYTCIKIIYGMATGNKEIWLDGSVKTTVDARQEWYKKEITDMTAQFDDEAIDIIRKADMMQISDLCQYMEEFKLSSTYMPGLGRFVVPLVKLGIKQHPGLDIVVALVDARILTDSVSN